MRTRYIYFLIDPRTMKPFYVGVTLSPETRLNSHSRKRRIIRRRLSPTEQYIVDMLSDGYKPQMTIIDQIRTFDLNEVHALERSWMLKLLDLGHSLTNRQISPMHFYGQSNTPYSFDENGNIVRLTQFVKIST